MSKKPCFLVGLAAAAVLLFTLASPARAQGPDRVPRFMLIDHSEVPLNWEAEGSVAMVVMPQYVEEQNCLVFSAGSYDSHENEWPDRVYGSIVSTLEKNLAERIVAGEITEDEIIAIADMLFGAFGSGAEPKTWLRQNQVTHVAKGGAQQLMNVYFGGVPPYSLWPSQGAMAQAGPDGDILVLGEFWFFRSDWTTPGARIVTDNYHKVEVRAQLAIGWFTK